MNSNIPEIHFEFIPLREISKHSDESFIGKKHSSFKSPHLFVLLHKDVIGIVDTCSDIIPFTNRTTNRDSKRREITIIDEDSSISITLWDEQVK